MKPLLDLYKFLMAEKVTVGQLYKAVLKADGYKDFYSKLSRNITKQQHEE